MRSLSSYKTILCLCLLTAGGAGLSCAEQADQDIFASVIVNSVFTMSLDNSTINFGYAKPGATIVLKDESPYNSVTCNSNKGKTWYLKIGIMGDMSGPAKKIPLDSFKWRVLTQGETGTAKTEWQGFTQDPQVAYTSGSGDNTGADTVLRFQYKLDLPGDAAGGYYNLKVMYTMTDVWS